ncbi:hypothetical protein [Wenjunlia tyrosinilytica]|jgi:hypothetical protein|uniref:Uncharacterized protein n=1 Tax=Wenjunlia tyrosinilytica TaxID=1544741 RepID=A0A917ZY42_9ACTN|nr:hypothetical protein [Wenjunlia tyrosinilytica]GGO98532.1 hypothetical protein GCM10012280_62890 [Wenjunlia tyrosinilytica]
MSDRTGPLGQSGVTLVNIRACDQATAHHVADPLAEVHPCTVASLVDDGTGLVRLELFTDTLADADTALEVGDTL